MAIGADELDRFAKRMDMSSAQAEELFRRLRTMNDAMDRGTSALDVAREAQVSLTQSQKNAINSVTQLGTSAYQSAKSLSGLPEQIASSASAMTSITPLVSAIADVSGQAAKLASTGIGVAIGQAFSPLGALIGGWIGSKIGEGLAETTRAIGGIMNFFLRESQKVIDSFTQLSSVGATFGGSLAEMKKLSADVSLSFETLAKIAVENADSLVLLGGGTQGALKLVTNTSKKLSNTFIALYGGLSNLNTEVAEYMASRRRQGVAEMATDQELIKQTGEYLYMMKELSALTGKNNKQIRSEIEQRTRNAAAQLVISEMTEKERNNFNYQLGLLPESLRGVYTDMVVARRTGNAAIAAETISLGTTMPTVAKKLESLVDNIDLDPTEAQKRFGGTLSGLREDVSLYRREFKDLMYVFTARGLSSSVVKTIDTVLTDLGENLGRLKTLPDDIRIFGEQTNKLKANSETFTNEVGLIAKEQEKIKIALNNMATDAGRFSLALGVTTSVLEMTEKVITGISDLLPTFLNKKGAEELRERARTELQRNPDSRVLQNQIDIYERGITHQKKVIDDMNSALSNAKSQDKDYYEKIKKISEDQIKKFQTEIDNLKKDQVEILKKTRDKDKTSSNDRNETPEAQTKMASNPIGSTNNPITVNWQDFADAILPYMKNQERLTEELRTAMSDQGTAIRKLANSMA